MEAKLLAVARALAFVLLALALCGLIFEFAGYSAPEVAARTRAVTDT